MLRGGRRPPPLSGPGGGEWPAALPTNSEGGGGMGGIGEGGRTDPVPLPPIASGSTPQGFTNGEFFLGTKLKCYLLVNLGHTTKIVKK